MDLKRYTNKAREALLAAQTLCVEQRHATIGPLHLLAALLRQDEGLAPRVVAGIGAQPGALLHDIDERLKRETRVSGQNVQVGAGRALQETLLAAAAQARNMRDDYLSCEHLLLALTGVAPTDALLARHGVSADAILQALTAIRGNQRITSQGPRGHFQQPGALRPRPDRAGASGTAGPGHRPRRGNPPRQPGAGPPQQEQPGAHRRGRRR